MTSALFTRRALLRAGASAVLLANLPRISFSDEQRLVQYRLKLQPVSWPLVGNGHPESAVWAYNGQLPGPTLRARRGDRLRITVDNGLAEDTTVHWHGIRLPNAMDGVPDLTQPPIKPGESYVYEFELPDSGSYWYHPHANSAEQVGRGLSGPLIIDEPDDANLVNGFDRDLIWFLDDWRLDGTAAIQPFGNGHDMTHGGRIGNTVTINGKLPEPLTVRAGERLRLRLLNAANARHFALEFEDHVPLVIALDGQSVEPFIPEANRVIVAPAQRVDILLDASAKPESKTRVIDTFYRDAYLLTELAYSDQPLREKPLGEPPRLARSRLPIPDIANAERHEVVLAGGAMGGMRGATMNDQWLDIRTLVSKGAAWALNGVAAGQRHIKQDPLFTFTRGRSVVLAMRNDSAFPHPMHLHGHHYRLISRNGKPLTNPPWHDTVLLLPRDTVEVAFVADNPGDWMFHCHIPEHMKGGMMGIVRVT
ncbi:MAG: multicopper oxidase family protein [Candidatus Competibacteraceae bacterium]|nr:multicopper oxidase family protein [Candidatus Competibacteraceae bacterium]